MIQFAAGGSLANVGEAWELELGNGKPNQIDCCWTMNFGDERNFFSEERKEVESGDEICRPTFACYLMFASGTIIAKPPLANMGEGG